MNALYFTLAADGSQVGPVAHAQIVVYLQQGVLRKESLVRRADLAEFFAIESYPEFTNVEVVSARPVAVPRVVAGAVRPKVATAKVSGGTKMFLWGMAVVWLGFFLWGAKWAYDKWQESAAATALAEAEKWKAANLPEFRVVSIRKRIGNVLGGGEVELAVDGEIEEKSEKRHPVHGRAERRDVWVRLAFVSSLGGEIDIVPLELQWVKVKEGKGSFTMNKIVAPEDGLKLIALWEKIQIEGTIKYEK